MDDMLKNNTPSCLAVELGKLLRDYRGGDVVVLDLREISGWTDFFVIATVTSSTHLYGLERHIKEFSKEKEIDIFRVSPRPKRDPAASEDEWLIIDLGAIAVHLMTSKTRAFYDLERLWSAAAVIFQENPAAVPPV